MAPQPVTRNHELALDEAALADASLARCAASGDLDLRAWYVRLEPGAPPTPVANLETLRRHLQGDIQTKVPDGSLLAEAQAAFVLELERVEKRAAEIVHRQRTAHYLALRAQAQRLLLHAALIELALGQSPNLFDDEVYPLQFNEQAILGLQRHRFPWGPLLKLAYQPGMVPNPNDEFFLKISGESREELIGRLRQLQHEARRLVKALSDAAPNHYGRRKRRP